jgi:cytochrome c-type biogenesis protein CcmF
MIVEIGHLCLIIALVLSLVLSVTPLLGVAKSNVTLMRTGESLAVGQFVFIAISTLAMVWAFVNDDFSVAYIAQNSNSALPVQFKVSALWGGHEGSLLLWVLVLAGWTLAVALRSEELPLDMRARVLAVMGMIATGFLLFVLFTSNPFERVLPFTPLEGNDLNPLLQDFGLIVHPPMLYMGYVGFSVAFAFAIAALLSGRLDSAWARWSRPWTNAAWMFLTAGIALGSWWAYYELGWGGWWFWDPVENASFMPWLVGTALIHSLAVTEKRGVYKSWTLLLAIFAFSLSLLGTFLVRSGVLTSVHAFATDPTRGLFILVFLLVVVGGSLFLYALRAPSVVSTAKFSFLSREVFLLINNILFLVATLMVLFGTLFPLLMDALSLGKYSVGPPYFNSLFVPMMAVLAMFMGIGPWLNWKKNNSNRIVHSLIAPLIACVVFGLLAPLFMEGDYSVGAAIGLVIAFWVISALIVDIKNKTKHASSIFAGAKRLSRSYWAMQLAHLGFAVTIIGVSLTSTYSSERDVRMAVGESFSQGGYEFTFLGTKGVQGPNYVADRGEVVVSVAGEEVLRLWPEKRRYTASDQVMTEASIDPSITRDIYIAMGDALDDGAWSVRVHIKPFVRWIWFGAIFMCIGAILSITDKRYKRKLAVKTPAPMASPQEVSV